MLSEQFNRNLRFVTITVSDAPQSSVFRSDCVKFTFWCCVQTRALYQESCLSTDLAEGKRSNFSYLSCWRIVNGDAEAIQGLIQELSVMNFDALRSPDDCFGEARCTWRRVQVEKQHTNMKTLHWRVNSIPWIDFQKKLLVINNLKSSPCKRSSQVVYTMKMNTIHWIAQAFNKNTFESLFKVWNPNQIPNLLPYKERL